MKLFRPAKNLGKSLLTLRLWRFTGSAILNLVIFTMLAPLSLASSLYGRHRYGKINHE